MQTSKYAWFITAFIMISGIATLAAESGAIESPPKTPEERAADSAQQALEKYNNGVKHMDKARSYDAQSDSLFAFNYRATSTAKAEKEYDKAVKDFRRAVELRPNMIEAHNNLGYCLRKLNKLDESMKAYAAALAIDSLYAPAREYRGELFLAMGDLNRANAELVFLRRVDSPYADTLALSIDLFHLQQVAKGMKR
ncbi:MAG: tetratricopeptide repeat protein [Candidatus Zixiibacteriota bacterium]